jgi:hypothetical protein
MSLIRFRVSPALDGLISGCVATLVLLTIWGFGQTVKGSLEDRPTLTGEAARSFRLEVEGGPGHHVRLRLPAGIVERFAGFVGDAEVRFDDAVSDSHLDFGRIWKGLETIPAGGLWEEIHDEERIAARRDGNVIEIVVERTSTGKAESESGDEEVATGDGSEPASTAAAPPSVAVRGRVSPPIPPIPSVPPVPAVPPIPSTHPGFSIGHDQGKVVLRLPASLVQRLAGEGPDTHLSLAEVVHTMRLLGPIEILRVESDEETVRISLD